MGLTTELPEKPTPHNVEHHLRRRGLLAAGAVAFALILLVVFFKGRDALAANDRSNVHVRTDVVPLECEQTTLSIEHTEYGDAKVAYPVAEIQSDMLCRFRFNVANLGDHDVTLERVLWPGLGPDWGTAVEAMAMESVKPSPNARDAIFNVDLSLPGNSVRELIISFVYRPGACMGAGLTQSYPDHPTVSVRSRGVTGERSLFGTAFGVRGTVVSQSACDSPSR